MRSWSKHVPLMIALFGIAYTFIELVMNLADGSLCTTDGCRVVDSFARYGEIPVLLIGLVFFAGVSALFIYRLLLQRSWRPKLLRLPIIGDSAEKVLVFIDAMLISGLAVEGYLVGFQIVSARAFCHFCLGIFAIIVILTISYSIIYRRYTALVAILSFASVLFITFLINVPNAPVDLKKIASEKIGAGNSDITGYIFYGKECSQCEDVIQYCHRETLQDVIIYLCPADKCEAALRTFGIADVPAMLIDNGEAKEILTGGNPILEYLELFSSNTTSAADNVLESSSSQSF